MINKSGSWTYTLPYSLCLLVPIDIIASLGMDLYLPVLPEMVTVFLVSSNLVQLSLTFYMMMLGVGQLVFGPLSDKIGRRPVVLIGCGIYCFSSAVIAFSNVFWLFLVCRLFQAMAASAMLVAAFATVRDVFSESKDGVIIYAMMGSILAFVPALAPIMGAIINHYANWQGIFITLAVLSALTGIHTLFRWNETRPLHTLPFEWGQFSIILCSRSFLAYTIAFATAMGTFFVYFSTAPSILMTSLGYSKIEFSLWFGSVALVMIITARFVRYFVASWGEKGIVYRALFLLVGAAVTLTSFEQVLGIHIVSFMVPMYVIAVSISMICSVSANGALKKYNNSAGFATALYYCVESIFLIILGSIAIEIMPTASTMPLSLYIIIASIITFLLIRPLPP
ncbi:MAG: multidrug effflux MFS transporter [Candidatus Endonucleobacter sp. (ex Gigantidas childressi)]|nr:multidrug effflux MFS transporter [Candidatus Endonucleobacter sp. (ex Gigantidas childressi)]